MRTEWQNFFEIVQKHGKEAALFWAACRYVAGEDGWARTADLIQLLGASNFMLTSRWGRLAEAAGLVEHRYGEYKALWHGLCKANKH